MTGQGNAQGSDLKAFTLEAQNLADAWRQSRPDTNAFLTILERSLSGIRAGSHLAHSSGDNEASIDAGLERARRLLADEEISPEPTGEEPTENSLFVPEDNPSPNVRTLGDKDASVDDPDECREDHLSFELGPGELWCNEEVALVHEWLGPERSSMIMDLQGVQPLKEPEFSSRQRFPWQLIGSAKILHLCKGPSRGVLEIDEMGLGKTVTAIDAVVAAEYDHTKPFSLVVTTRSCVHQWVEESQVSFQEGKRPRIFVLNDQRTTAMDLITGDYDIVITTPGFIQSQYKAKVNFERFWKKVEEVGFMEAKRIYKSRGSRWERPTLALMSDIYMDLGYRIKFLILDEVQIFKKFNGVRHKAIKALKYDAVVMLSGTPFGNRYTDIFGILDLLPNEPLTSIADYLRIFGNVKKGLFQKKPSPTNFNRLLKYLMSFTFGRPISLLPLPSITRHTWRFNLEPDTMALVTYHIELFYKAMRARDLSADDNFVLVHAVRAQQLACSSLLYREASTDWEKKVSDMAAKLQSIFEKALEGKEGVNMANRPQWARLSSSERKARGPKYQIALSQWQVDAKAREKLNTTATKEFKDGSKAQKDTDRAEGSSHDDLLSTSEEEEVPETEWEAEYHPSLGLPNETLIGAEDDSAADEDGYESDKKKRGSHAEDERRWLKELKEATEEEIFHERVRALFDLYDHVTTHYPGEKIVIWSRYLKFLDIIEKAFKDKKRIMPLRYDGRLDEEERINTLNLFRRDIKQGLLLITPGSGGAGLNITAASQAIFLEPWWNKQDMAQAERRFWRSGQIVPVHIWELFADNSAVDNLVCEGGLRKLSVISLFMDRLRREDDDEPVIPEIVKSFGGFILDKMEV